MLNRTFKKQKADSPRIGLIKMRKELLETYAPSSSPLKADPFMDDIAEYFPHEPLILSRTDRPGISAGFITKPKLYADFRQMTLTFCPRLDQWLLKGVGVEHSKLEKLVNNLLKSNKPWGGKVPPFERPHFAKEQQPEQVLGKWPTHRIFQEEAFINDLFSHLGWDYVIMPKGIFTLGHDKLDIGAPRIGRKFVLRVRVKTHGARKKNSPVRYSVVLAIQVLNGRGLEQEGLPTNFTLEEPHKESRMLEVQ